MKRFLLDTVLVILFVMIGKQLLNESKVMTIEERIEQFNQQVENQEVIDHPSHLHLNQTEENTAGKLGETLGNMIYTTVYYTMETIALFFDEN